MAGIGQGGGFFGSGASSTSQTSHASEVGQQLNEASGSQAFGWGNLSASGKNSKVDVTVNTTTTDNGAMKAAMELAGRVFESQNNSVLANYDIVNTGAKMVLDINKVNTDLNSEFLGAVGDWNAVASKNARDLADMSERQTKAAYDFIAGENDANRSLLIDANASIGNAWESANRGLMNFAFDTTNKYATMSNEAVKQIANTAQYAQTATQKTMDMIFESTKAPDERVLTSSMKWVVGGLIAAVGLFVIAPKLVKA